MELKYDDNETNIFLNCYTYNNLQYELVDN